MAQVFPGGPEESSQGSHAGSFLRNPDFGRRPLEADSEEGAAVQGSLAAIPPLGALGLGGGAPGFAPGLWGCWSMPPAQPQKGPGARWALG